MTCAVVACLLTGCTIERADVRTPSGRPPEADTTRVRKAMETIAAAIERGDLSALDTIYHDSVLVFEGGRVDRGWRQYREEHLRAELAWLQEIDLEFRDISVRLDGGTAWATFRYRLRGTHGGEAIDAHGVGTMVFQKLAGRWRLVHSHTSQPGSASDGT